MSTLRPLALVLLLGCTGCSLEPTYQRPASPLPAQFPQAPAADGTTTAAAPDWQDFFKDPALQQLLQQALADNRSLRIVAARLDEARASYGAQRAGLFPALSLQGYAGRQRLPALVQAPGNGLLGPVQNNRGQASVFNTFQVQAGLTSYELDFMGRQRSSARAGQRRAEAADADYAAARLTLIGEVANAYLALCADRALLALTEQTWQTQTDHAQVLKKAFSDGGVAEFDWRRADSLAQNAQVDLAAARIRVGQDLNALALLVGQPVDPALGEPQAWSGASLPELPAGLPSTLLTRRPDISAAEARLRAANADIGAARAAFFPSIALTALFGSLSGQLSSLFGAGSSAWNSAVGLDAPLLDFGRRKQDLNASRARYRGQLAAYEDAVQNAFREVADALVVREQAVGQLDSQRQLVDQLDRVYTIAQRRFTAGMDDYIAVQDAQRTLYLAQQRQIELQLGQQVNLVNLYKALGGGWHETSVQDKGQLRIAGALR